MGAIATSMLEVAEAFLFLAVDEIDGGPDAKVCPAR